MGQQLVERGGHFTRGHVNGDIDMSALWTVEQSVNFDFLAVLLLLVAEQLRLEDRKLRLRLEDVLLGGAPGGVTAFGDTQDGLQKLLVALGEGDGDAGVMQFVVGLLEAGDDAQADGEILLEFGIGLFGGNLTAQFLFAREGHFLRDHDAGVGDGRDANAGYRVGSAAGGVAERDGGLGQGTSLGGPLAGSFVFLLRGQDLAVVAQGFVYQRRQGLRGSQRGESQKTETSF